MSNFVNCDSNIPSPFPAKNKAWIVVEDNEGNSKLGFVEIDVKGRAIKPDPVWEVVQASEWRNQEGKQVVLSHEQADIEGQKFERITLDVGGKAISGAASTLDSAGQAYDVGKQAGKRAFPASFNEIL